MRILVTAGPTREFIDTVRFISNAASGRMGFAIAESACRRGHHVVLVTGPVNLDAPPVDVVEVTTAEQMLAACRSRFNDCDAAIMTAAVTDWRPTAPLDHKAAKAELGMSLSLEPTPDVLATLAEGKGRRIVIGFAVQDADARRRAEEKLRNKHCDAIVLNGPEALGAQHSTIQIKLAGQHWGAPTCATKLEHAETVVDLVERMLRGRDD